MEEELRSPVRKVESESESKEEGREDENKDMEEENLELVSNVMGESLSDPYPLTRNQKPYVLPWIKENPEFSPVTVAPAFSLLPFSPQNQTEFDDFLASFPPVLAPLNPNPNLNADLNHDLNHDLNADPTFNLNPDLRRNAPIPALPAISRQPTKEQCILKIPFGAAYPHLEPLDLNDPYYLTVKVIKKDLVIKDGKCLWGNVVVRWVILKALRANSSYVRDKLKGCENSIKFRGRRIGGSLPACVLGTLVLEDNGKRMVDIKCLAREVFKEKAPEGYRSYLPNSVMVWKNVAPVVMYFALGNKDERGFIDGRELRESAGVYCTTEALDLALYLLQRMSYLKEEGEGYRVLKH